MRQDRLERRVQEVRRTRCSVQSGGANFGAGQSPRPGISEAHIRYGW